MIRRMTLPGQPSPSGSIGAIIDLLLQLHPLDRIPRSGYLLRGVAEPESVAAHSHTLTLLVSLVAPLAQPPMDVLVAMRMALIHDLPESKTMDIPLPVGDSQFRAAKTAVENDVFDRLFNGQDAQWKRLFAEFQAGSSAEARLVKGLDKVQMMAKVMGYEREGRGRLEDFWANEENFRDYGIAIVAELFAEILSMAGRNGPKG
jgi:putative hydrolase of HD superfamily